MLPDVLIDQIHHEPMSGCWLWVGNVDRGGYGTIAKWKKDGRKGSRAVHKVIYEILVGDVPDGLQLDHLCEVKPCVNPQHLEPVTPRENTQRSIRSRGLNSVAATLRDSNLAKTHCPHGHPYSGENLYVRPNGVRECRECWKRKPRREGQTATTGSRA